MATKKRQPIELGCKARDVVTKFTGIVVGRTEWLNGCVRYALQPDKLDKDGKAVESMWVDIEQLEVIPGGVKLPSEPGGGPKPTPRRQRDPVRR